MLTRSNENVSPSHRAADTYLYMSTGESPRKEGRRSWIWLVSSRRGARQNIPLLTTLFECFYGSYSLMIYISLTITMSSTILVEGRSRYMNEASWPWKSVHDTIDEIQGPQLKTVEAVDPWKAWVKHLQTHTIKHLPVPLWPMTPKCRLLSTCETVARHVLDLFPMLLYKQGGRDRLGGKWRVSPLLAVDRWMLLPSPGWGGGGGGGGGWGGGARFCWGLLGSELKESNFNAGWNGNKTGI